MSTPLSSTSTLPSSSGCSMMSARPPPNNLRNIPSEPPKCWRMVSNVCSNRSRESLLIWSIRPIRLVRAVSISATCSASALHSSSNWSCSPIASRFTLPSRWIFPRSSWICASTAGQSMSNGSLSSAGSESSGSGCCCRRPESIVFRYSSCRSMLSCSRARSMSPSAFTSSSRRSISSLWIRASAASTNSFCDCTAARASTIWASITASLRSMSPIAASS